MSAQPVNAVDPTTGEVIELRPPLPMFEGEVVEGGARLRLTGMAGLPCADDRGERALHVDDTVHLEVDARVVAVHHVMDKDDLRLQRLHVLRVVDAGITPWEPGHDDGVKKLRDL